MRVPGLGAMLLLSACSDVRLTVDNDGPEAEITTPLLGVPVLEGRVTAFIGQVSDADDRPDELLVTWQLEDQTICGPVAPAEDGSTTCALTLTEDALVVTLTARDPSNATGQDRRFMQLIDDEPPTATLLRPLEGDAVRTGQTFVLEGEVADAEDAATSLAVRWISDRDGELGRSTPGSDGRVVSQTSLTTGTHLVTLEVTDTIGQVTRASAQVTARESNVSPTCGFTSPAAAAVIAADEALSIVVAAADPDGGPVGLTARVTSDISGLVGEAPADAGGTATIVVPGGLVPGPHNLTLTVTDSEGATCGDARLLLANRRPVVQFLRPTDGDDVAGGVGVSVGVEATDLETAGGALDLLVTSTTVGVVFDGFADAAGRAERVVSLPGGAQRLIATVVDGAGLIGRAEIDLSVDAAPSAPVVRILPDPAGTADELVATIDVPSVDPEGQGVSYRYAWTVDGVDANVSADRVSAAQTERGERWAVAVYPSDGRSEGRPGEAARDVENSLPRVVGVAVEPADPVAGDTLRCTIGAVVDADGDPFDVEVAWEVNGLPAGTGDELAPQPRGTDVRCVVTATDPFGSGPAEPSATVRVRGQLPTLASATITPAPATALQALTCVHPAAQDVEGDPVTVGVVWEIGGVEVAQGPVLPARSATRGEVVVCVATPTDRDGAGVSARSLPLVLSNAPPSAQAAALDPAAPTAESPPTCVLVGADDADGDNVTAELRWQVAGSGAGTGPNPAPMGIRGQVVRCEATPTDGTDDGTPVSVQATIGNSPARVTGVRLDPASPTAATPVVCRWDTPTDADGDAVGVDVSWTLDGSVVGSGATLSAGVARRGGLLRCTVSPTDPLGAGVPGTAEATVGNAIPGLASVAITPSPLRAGNVARCTPSGFQDADGDADRTTLAWTVDGQAAGTTPTLSATLHRGQQVRCVATPFDGLATGTPRSADVTVANTPPTATSASITPGQPDRTSTLGCTADDFADADGDADASTVAWRVNGQPQGNTPTFAGLFGRGDTVRCTLTVSDGVDPGPTLQDEVVIGNAAPFGTGARIEPTQPDADEPLTCVGLGLIDPDGDHVDVLVTWEINGQPAGTGNTLPPGSAAHGDVVTCTLLPSDGDRVGDPLTSPPVAVANATPTVGNVWIEPEPPTASDVVRCFYDGFNDGDGDPDRSRITWTVDGQPAGSGERLNVAVRRDDVVVCTVTPNDGIIDGVPRPVSTTVANSPPVLAGVTITPNPATRAGSLTCTATGASDADGDRVDIAYAWSVNGSAAGSGTVLSSGFVRGDSVACAATPYDGADTGTTVSAVVTITNAPPRVVSASFGPEPLYGHIDAVATATGSDPDGDGVTFRYAWMVNGVPRGADSPTLSAVSYARGDSVSLRVTPFDGLVTGPAVTVGPVVVANAPPGAPGLVIEPAEPYARDPLLCRVATPSVDPDGDAVSYTFSWLGPLGPLTTPITTLRTGDTVPGVAAVGGSWTCTATPRDALGLDGTPASAQVTVRSPFGPPLVPVGAVPVEIYSENGFVNLGSGDCPIATPDLDGDGIDDVVLGLPEINLSAGNDAGAVRIYFGKWLRRGGRYAIGQAHVAIDGIAPAAKAGSCVADAGDLDGDGRDELLIGAAESAPAGLRSGTVYLFFGADIPQPAAPPVPPAPQPNTAVLLTLNDASRIWTGSTSEDRAGLFVGQAADLDGGGRPELLIGAPQREAAGFGRLYVISGEALPPSGTLDSASWFTFVSGSVGIRAGAWALGDQDIDGDGAADLVIGAPAMGGNGLPARAGGAYVILGRQLPGALNPFPLTASWARIVGEATSDYSGGRIVGIGDLDDDGRDDLAVGAASHTSSGTLDRGRVYLVPGADLANGGDVPLAALPGVLGGAAADFAGTSLVAVGDRTDDGLPELLVGVPGWDAPYADGGAVALFSSQFMVLGLTATPDLADHVFQPASEEDELGASVASGDVDGDGRADLIFAASRDNTVTNAGGRVFVVFGP